MFPPPPKWNPACKCFWGDTVHCRGVTTIETREATASSLFILVHVDRLHPSHGRWPLLQNDDHFYISAVLWLLRFWIMKMVSQDLNGIWVTKCPKITLRGCQIQIFSGRACPQTHLERCGLWPQLSYHKLPPVSENPHSVCRYVL